MKQVIKAAGKIGVPQGGPFSPLASNIYLNEVDWALDAIRRKTAEGNYEAVNYHRFADDMVVTVSGHSSKRGWAELALQRLREQLEPLGVEYNLEKTRMVNVLKGESFSFLGFDLRRVLNQSRTGYFILMTPKKKARTTVKARIRELIKSGGSKPAKDIVKQAGVCVCQYHSPARGTGLLHVQERKILLKDVSIFLLDKNFSQVLTGST